MRGCIRAGVCVVRLDESVCACDISFLNTNMVIMSQFAATCRLKWLRGGGKEVFAESSPQMFCVAQISFKCFCLTAFRSADASKLMPNSIFMHAQTHRGLINQLWLQFRNWRCINKRCIMSCLTCALLWGVWCWRGALEEPAHCISAVSQMAACYCSRRWWTVAGCATYFNCPCVLEVQQISIALVVSPSGYW